MAEGDAELSDLYRDVLLDYYRSAARKGKLDSPDLRSHGVNPVCGDEVELTATREGERIGLIRYSGRGCVISQASTAMMAEALEGRSLAEARRLVETFHGMMTRRLEPAEMPEELEETRALEGVRNYPVRVKCALLGWNTMRLGLEPGADVRTAEYSERD